MVSASTADSLKDANMIRTMKQQLVARTDAKNVKMATIWMKEVAKPVVTQSRAVSSAYHPTSALSVRVSS